MSEYGWHNGPTKVHRVPARPRLAICSSRDNTVNLSSTGDLLLRWKKRVNHLNKILKALLWQKGLGRRQMALFGFVLIVDLLDFTTIDAQETRRQDHCAHITLEPPADGFGVLRLHDLCKGDRLTELEHALRKA